MATYLSYRAAAVEGSARTDCLGGSDCLMLAAVETIRGLGQRIVCNHVLVYQVGSGSRVFLWV
jgi:hypothetical protein